MRYVLIGLLTVSLFLLYSLTLATGNANKMGDYFWLFFGLNGSLLVVLLVMLLKQILVIQKNIKKRVFGAKLTRKLVLSFALVAILPSFFLLTVSIQFISQSIESWFGQTIDATFNNGVELGQVVLDERLQLSKEKTLQVQRFFGEDSNDQEKTDTAVSKEKNLVEQIQEKSDADHVVLSRMPSSA